MPDVADCLLNVYEDLVLIARQKFLKWIFVLPLPLPFTSSSHELDSADLGKVLKLALLTGHQSGDAHAGRLVSTLGDSALLKPSMATAAAVTYFICLSPLCVLWLETPTKEQARMRGYLEQ